MANHSADAFFTEATMSTYRDDDAATARPAGARPDPQCARREAAAQARTAQTAAPQAAATDRASANDAQARRIAAVERACRQIEAAETAPTLEELAAAASMSPFHFHRIFKAETGLTPKAYADAHRARRLRDTLAATQSRDREHAPRQAPGQSPTVTQAAYDAGFNASSRFYEKSDAMLGMQPSHYRDGGAQARIVFAVAQCSLGALLVARSERGLCAISLGDDPEPLVRELQDRFPKAILAGGDKDFEQLLAQVVGFIEQPALGLNLPLDIRGTAFQERVWRALREIPAGCTVTYSELASRIGSPAAVRAVASACAANTLAVAVPCHRVVRLDGMLTGYRWGIDRKRELLHREANIGEAAKAE